MLPTGISRVRGQRIILVAATMLGAETAAHGIFPAAEVHVTCTKCTCNGSLEGGMVNVFDIPFSGKRVRERAVKGTETRAAIG